VASSQGRSEMNIEERINGLKLTPEEIDKAFDGAFDKPIEFDHKPTPDEIILIRLKAVAQTQLNKVLNDPDLKISGGKLSRRRS